MSPRTQAPPRPAAPPAVVTLGAIQGLSPLAARILRQLPRLSAALPGSSPNPAAGSGGSAGGTPGSIPSPAASAGGGSAGTAPQSAHPASCWLTCAA